MLNKVQNTIAKMKIRALISSKGEGIVKGLKFKVGSKTLTIEEIKLHTNLPLAEFNISSIEHFSCNYEEYELNLVVKGLSILSPEGELSVEEFTVESILELKQFALEIKGLIQAIAEESQVKKSNRVKPNRVYAEVDFDND